MSVVPSNYSNMLRHYDVNYLSYGVSIKTLERFPDSMVPGTNMGPIWGRQDQGGPHVDHVNFALWVSAKKMGRGGLSTSRVGLVCQAGLSCFIITSTISLILGTQVKFWMAKFVSVFSNPWYGKMYLIACKPGDTRRQKIRQTDNPRMAQPAP